MMNWKRKLSEEESDDSKQSFITLDTNSLLNNSAPVGNKIYL